MAVLRGDAEASREAYTDLEPHRGLMLVLGGIANDRLLGLLARTMGDDDRAATHFEDSLAFCRKSGYRPELAWSCCDYADMLLQRSAEGDRARAVSLLDQSFAVASGLGMQPLMKRVTALQEQAEAQPCPGPGLPRRVDPARGGSHTAGRIGQD